MGVLAIGRVPSAPQVLKAGGIVGEVRQELGDRVVGSRGLRSARLVSVGRWHIVKILDRSDVVKSVDTYYAPHMGGGPLAGCRAKLERAETHLDSLNDLIDPFLESEPKPYRLFTKVDVDTARYIGVVGISREPPLEWSAIAGDFLQNLRAALDHLIWVLIRANGQRPSGGSAFPIFDQMPPKKSSHPERQRWNRQVGGVHPGVLHFIQLCQPYAAPDGPRGNVLAGLRTLSNEDKHRTLIPAFAAIASRPDALKIDHIWVRDVSPLEGLKFETGKPLENGDQLFEAPITITGPNPEIKLKGDFALDIGFGRKPVPLEGFVQMQEFVAFILERSRDFLGE